MCVCLCDHWKLQIIFIQCGGTIDKCYPRMTKGYAFEFGEFSATQNMLSNELRDMINFEPVFVTVCKKDSMEMDDNDREKIIDMIRLNTVKYDTNLIIITHGTDTMIRTAKYISNKLKPNKYCVVLSGSMKPAKFVNSDAMLNLGCAISSVQLMNQFQNYGVYVTMNGRTYECHSVQRNLDNGLFIASRYSKL
eukprot:306732_1